MSDLVKRLREGHISEWYAREREAADRIELLDGIVRGLLETCDYAVAQHTRPQDFDPRHNHWTAKMWGAVNKAREAVK